MRYVFLQCFLPFYNFQSMFMPIFDPYLSDNLQDGSVEDILFLKYHFSRVPVYYTFVQFEALSKLIATTFFLSSATQLFCFGYLNLQIFIYIYFSSIIFVLSFLFHVNFLFTRIFNEIMMKSGILKIFSYSVYLILVWTRSSIQDST